jgi:hypothetical protein
MTGSISLLYCQRKCLKINPCTARFHKIANIGVVVILWIFKHILAVISAKQGQGLFIGQVQVLT